MIYRRVCSSRSLSESFTLSTLTQLFNESPKSLEDKFNYTWDVFLTPKSIKIKPKSMLVISRLFDQFTKNYQRTTIKYPVFPAFENVELVSCQLSEPKSMRGWFGCKLKCILEFTGHWEVLAVTRMDVSVEWTNWKSLIM